MFQVLTASDHFRHFRAAQVTRGSEWFATQFSALGSVIQLQHVSGREEAAPLALLHNGAAGANSVSGNGGDGNTGAIFCLLLVRQPADDAFALCLRRRR